MKDIQRTRLLMLSHTSVLDGDSEPLPEFEVVWEHLARYARDHDLEARHVLTARTGSKELDRRMATQTAGQVVVLKAAPLHRFFTLLKESKHVSILHLTDETILDIFTAVCAKLRGARVALSYRKRLRKDGLRRIFVSFLRVRVVDAFMTDSMAIKKEDGNQFTQPMFLLAPKHGEQEAVTASQQSSYRVFARAYDALLAGLVAEEAFYASHSFPLLRRIKRLMMNQKVDFCNHIIRDGKAVKAEQAALSDYCIGRGADIGCGSNKVHESAIGIDLTPGGMRGRFGNQKGEVSAADIRASGDYLPMFRTGELDYVVASHNLEHYQDPIKTLREWKRVVRPGGTIAIVVPDDTFRNTIVLDPTHYHVFTPESFRTLIELIGGLDIIRLDVCIEDWSFICVMKTIS